MDDTAALLSLADRMLWVTALVAAPALAQDAKTPQAEADTFVSKAEKEFNQAVIESGQAGWVYETYINQDTEALTARADAAVTTLMVTPVPSVEPDTDLRRVAPLWLKYTEDVRFDPDVRRRCSRGRAVFAC